MQKIMRIFGVMMLAFGFMTAAVSVTSAHESAGPDVARFIGSDTLAENDDLVEQLVQVLIEILDQLLNGGDNLADLLPEACSVEVGGFSCDIDSADASLFLSETCEPSIFDDDIYLCSVAGVVYSCNIYGPTSILICNPS